MNIFTITVVHGDEDLLITLGSLQDISLHSNYSVIVIDNLASPKLRIYCEHNNILYYARQKPTSFAANNNFGYIKSREFSKSAEDTVIFMNPDVHISINAFRTFAENVVSKSHIYAPNLFLNSFFLGQDDNIRRFPTMLNFLSSLLLKDRTTILERNTRSENNLKQIGSADWASFALVGMKAGTYESLGGLDESYPMYCEDIDFFYRAKLKGAALCYLHSIKAVHLRNRRSRNVLSLLFIKHAVSAIFFTLRRAGFRKGLRSSLIDDD